MEDEWISLGMGNRIGFACGLWADGHGNNDDFRLAVVLNYFSNLLYFTLI